MKTIKEICSLTSNEGLNEKEANILDAYTDNLYWAWANWSDDLIREFWEGSEKPKEPTASFQEDYYQNEDFDQYGEEEEENQEESLTYNVVFNNESNSNDKGFKSSKEDCISYIKNNNGSNDSLFEDYKGGTVSVVCNETGEDVFYAIVK